MILALASLEHKALGLKRFMKRVIVDAAEASNLYHGGVLQSEYESLRLKSRVNVLI